jgi:hypothetical protein
MHWYALHRSTRLVLRRQGNVVRQRARHGCILSRRSDISTQIIDGIIFIFFFLTQLLWSFRSCLYGLDQPFRVTRSSRFARRSNGSRISTDRRRRGNVFFFSTTSKCNVLLAILSSPLFPHPYLLVLLLHTNSYAESRRRETFIYPFTF